MEILLGLRRHRRGGLARGESGEALRGRGRVGSGRVWPAKARHSPKYHVLKSLAAHIGLPFLRRLFGAAGRAGYGKF